MDIFQHILTLQGKRLATLDRNRPFTVKYVSPDEILITVHSTAKTRTIALEEVTDSWEQLVASGHLTRARIEKRFSPRNPAYVAALLATIPGISVTLRPITLLHHVR